MRSFTRELVLLSLVLLMTACSTVQSARSSGDARLITRDQITGTNYQSAFDLVRALRSNWMHARGANSIQGKSTEVLVYMDDVKLGGVESLRGIEPLNVDSIEFIDGIAAAGRWGLDHGSGVIRVTSRLRG